MAGDVIEQIKIHIDNDENFLLSGGAGSGKTHALTEVLKYIFEKDPIASVACITYTNVAANEIKERSPYENLRVSTIHDFLWNAVKDYQKNLKTSVVELINEKGITYKGELELNTDYFKDKSIQYKEYKKLEEGIISHDEVLKIANYMFKTYPLLCNILNDKYQYILIDEYQDTELQVVEIFLEFIQNDNKRKNIIGLFGDSMQSIYEKGVGNIRKYIEAEQGVVKEVIKPDNYRCSEAVINLLNNIRGDIKQKPSGQNLKGSAIFMYSNSNDIKISDIKKDKVFSSWDFSDVNDTKELYLTHKLIAKEKGFLEILESYSNKDRLIGDNKDKLAKHLFKIQEIIDLYETRNYNEFVKKTDFKINKLSQKNDLRNSIEKLKDINGKNIEDIINLSDKLNLIKIDDSLKEYIKEKTELYEKIKILPYRQIVNIYEFEKGNSPYSTQHGVKGAEFNNVFVVLDNGRWNQYNFQYLFEETGKESIIERTKKIFYVCCSRAKDNLVVFFYKPTPITITQAKNWFGDKNIIEI